MYIYYLWSAAWYQYMMGQLQVIIYWSDLAQHNFWKIREVICKCLFTYGPNSQKKKHTPFSRVSILANECISAYPLSVIVVVSDDYTQDFEMDGYAWTDWSTKTWCIDIFHGNYINLTIILMSYHLSHVQKCHQERRFAIPLW